MVKIFFCVCLLQRNIYTEGQEGEWAMEWGLPQSSSAHVCLRESEGNYPGNIETVIRRCRKKKSDFYSFSRPDIDFGVAGGKQRNDKS